MASYEPIETKTFEEASLTIRLFEVEGRKPYVAAVYFGEAFWDAYDFYSKVEADQFLQDPFKADRPKPEGPEELDRSYLALMTKLNTGRRIGPKPGAA